MSSSTQDKNSSLAPFTPTLPVGYVLRDYIIEKVLGKGNFGITYLVKEEMTDYPVVIKENFPTDFAYRDPTTGELRPMLQCEESYRWALESFEKEARTLRKLPKHPNFVHIIGVFPALNTAYIVMERIEGKNLAELYPQGSKMEPQLLEGILHKLLSALIPMHRLEIIHRDIKPANIMLTPEGEPVLIDFGAARPILGTHNATIIGTRGYAPPEQMEQAEDEDGEKQAPQPQPHWDLYALGCTCHQLITGRAPIHGARKLTERPELLANYPARLLSSIDKAREVAPADRWQSAQEWLDELDAEHKRKLEEEHRQKVEAEQQILRELEDEKLKVAAAQAALSAAEKKLKQAETARRSAEKKAKQAETARSTAEEKAKQAETARRATEEKAKQAETALSAAEEKAKQAETARRATEEKAKQAQAARRNAEEKARQAETAHYNAEERARQAKSEYSSRTTGNGFFKYTAITAGLLLASWSWLGYTDGPKFAAKKDYPNLLRSFLYLPGVDVDKPDKYGDTPLYTAAYKGRAECVKLLIDAGADVYKANQIGRIPSSSDITVQQLLREAREKAKQKTAKSWLQQQNITPEKYNTALLEAAEKGNRELITLLITAGADVNTADDDGWTPLYWAAWYGHTECVKLLINTPGINTDSHPPLSLAVMANDVEKLRKLLSSGNIDINAGDKYGDTPLYWAAFLGRTECVKLLIAAKADVNKANKYGSTPLSVAKTEEIKRLLREAAEKKPATEQADENEPQAVPEQEAAKSRLQQQNITPEKYNTALLEAAEKGNSELMSQLLTAGTDVNTVDENGHTPLFWAAWNGHTKCVKLLIAAKADVNKASNWGNTSLYSAASKGHTECVKLLIDAKANVNKADKDGKTPLFWASTYNHTECVKLLLAAKADVNKADKDGETPLFRAVCWGKTECVKLLIDAGADVNKASEDGTTPLSYAGLMGKTECVKLLIDAGADVNKANDDGTTPLSRAACWGRTECMKLLITAGADVNKANKWGETPLWWAAEKSHIECVKLLIDAGADVNKANNRGKTPLSVAKTEEIKQLLRAAGAKE